jgi:hypothetical protein
MTPDQILQSIPWRCFHCDFITSDPAEAEAHFGERDDAEEFKPICKWWDRMGEDERLFALQTTIHDLTAEQEENYRLRKQIEGLEYQVDANRSLTWRGYRPFRECHSINDIFCVYDSMEGRALAGEANAKHLARALETVLTDFHPGDPRGVQEPLRTELTAILQLYRDGRLSERKLA